MKIKIKKQVDEEIDVDFPYYFKNDLMDDYSDTVIYGKIDLNNYTAIKISKFEEAATFEIEVIDQKPEHFASYFKEEYKSTKEEFYRAKDKLVTFVSSQGE